MRNDDKDAPTSELILYRSEDAQTRIQVRLEGESVWLTQAQIAELYQVSVKTISEHLQNIYAEGEVEAERTVRKLRIVQAEGSRQVRRTLDHYNLDAILAVGYRVRSARGTQFRQWATARLSEYLIKGFALDDERLKRGPDDGYFEELLGRIRDIRSSEKLFWRKVLDIYATSVDYDPSAEASQRFFATVQNKMHWAAHGHTAAELLMERADASKPHSGMTNWVGAAPRASDAVVAKSYLNAEELGALNRIVTAYLEFAELQAMNRRPMTMAAWIAKLDDFLRLSDRDVLTHAGRIGREQALEFSKAEFARYRQRTLEEPSPVERDFEEATRKLKALESDKRRSTRTKGPTGE
ncbi:virulence RhuM family protein [Xanthomonas sp. LF07-6]|uniref:virulence RhuM family protein n=1 Tax=Xanthomonas sp. LF07-6 TaxID=3097550 RepID=UPI002A7F9C69|nr:virulence RhuM family protein [Xanthomonas sp. LF07-6]MDY4342066.1 virulence RhuM family protein [Xanthomonas sp. LF07-6]